MFVERVLISFFSEHPTVLKARRPIMVACSGGPDSTALVLALSRLQGRLPMTFCMGHVNHHLRGRASNGDAQFVRALSKQVGWPYIEKTAKVFPHHSGNLEERARIKRYKALGEMATRLNCQAVFTGHHLDDQAETVLMNMFRGAGVNGLAGMRDWRAMPECAVMIGRPLLGASRKDIEDYLKRHRQSYRTDKSNRNTQFLRNWIRRELLPALEKKSPLVTKRLSHLATILQAENDFWELEKKVALPLVTRPFRSGRLLDLKRLLRYPLAAQRRFLRGLVGNHLLTFERVEGWRKWMLEPPTGGRIWQLKQGWSVERLSKSKGAPSARLFWIHQK